ncbi:MAG: beta-ketoacyl synthase, partial [Acidobacteriota bacterium]|nr:beta-ketoacyl synthase [Acidobacteriota bacterium]
MSSFPPIAVIAHSCVLPGAFSPAELWAQIVGGNDLLSHAPPGYWRVNPEPLLSAHRGAKAIATDRGGYVRGFESLFDPDGFAVPAAELIALDPLFHWVLWGARTALEQAGHDCRKQSPRAGLILGNLGYPSPEATRYAEAVWTGATQRPAAANRFHFGLPTALAAKALRLELGGISLDAACASSLYAIKLACDRLHDGDADLMLAGGVNRSDSLFLHAGFTALGALSPTGQSLPFHRAADGLIPSEGGAFVVLKRLDDALVAGDPIACIIRGVGLSNDGRASGLLTPSMEGQVRAMRAAYRVAGFSPEHVSYVECHATGTPVGDDTEIRSMDAIFGAVPELAVGSLKANLGHLMTAAGAAGLIKVIEGMKAELLPCMRHADEPSAALRSSRFRISNQPRPWLSNGPRRAAVSAFGFGGNNAHLIVEQWTGTKPASTRIAFARSPLAVTGIGVIASDGNGADDFLRALGAGESPVARAERIELSSKIVRFPPKDLQDCDGQQLLILRAALEAVASAPAFSGERAGVFIAMESSAEIARHCAAWRIADAARAESGEPSAHWLQMLSDVLPPLTRAATVVGTMPNMPANRLNSQFDCRGPGFTIGAGELSGDVALRTAMRALRAGEIDLAIVGAVGLCIEPVHESAMAVRGSGPAGDGAVILILRRIGESENPDDVQAIIVETEPGISEARSFDGISVARFGDSYAAATLLDVAAAALCCRYRLNPLPPGNAASFWVSDAEPRRGQAGRYRIGAEKTVPFVFDSPPALHYYSGANRADVISAVQSRRQSRTGRARLVIAAATPAVLEERLQQAQHLLERQTPLRNATLAEGIFYADSPLEGELCFVFTGAGAAYPGMGKELLLALPEPPEGNVWSRHLETRAAWIYSQTDHARVTTEQHLYGASFLCQMHARFSLDVLRLKPSAALGLSSGESNALFAFGAWNDPEAMFLDIAASGMYDRELGGRFESVRREWKVPEGESVNWASWRVGASLPRIRLALETEPRVRMLIVHHEQDCLIGGDAAACERVLQALGSPPAQQSTHNLAIHCPEVRPFGEQWWKIHCRATSPVPGIRFYTNATGDWYLPEDGLTADMLLRQATETIDFPRTVRKAWDDGVRIFVEHGPRNLCSEWISRILGDRPHLAVALDRFGKSSVVQAIHAAGQLAAAGIDIPTEGLWEGRRPAPAPREHLLTFPAHPPAVKIPPFERDEDHMQRMPAAPLLPEAEPEPVETFRGPAAAPVFSPISSE